MYLGCSWLELTAPKSSRYSGYATITHPFHPWKGKSFQILSTKNFNNRDIFSLKTLTRGTVGIPRDWTDKADPNLYQTLTDLSPILSFSHLQQLVKLVTNLDQAKNSKEVD
ncbi:DUF5372 family protein [Wolbachia endosymbiont of Folsomia candida]|uniref:DUF5372 family protein n=1 Tax=Wolbachia endosymbiont of Folsomia candida TaxID=169402 RepID=UPI000B5E8291|nr:DUF5372 family protein [Wolbachia endosymbiont of Folsomia candida]APR97795.1 hypothetical protein ASM33_00340 [Wolbachia endosymbiont of Folsomia candida]APR97815.1 hypothetical protein ASM33_00485 [Wolbachia endosymbiont of Folsomia candida]APR97842.1 hypothetical protein ASM33_00645 [Wolbachia endosymbiont of Folsomia candida]APR98686.1 hypothetical protein ASM33_05580 [Wolbachia endosymbiont of Folsomia candida]APR98944.1 hypothetical protein ASM33_07080 [Wolbachia endosymbiont of Folso